MAQIQSDPILLRDIPNDAMYIGREWWEFYRAQERELRTLRSCLRALARDYPDGVPITEIEKLGHSE